MYKNLTTQTRRGRTTSDKLPSCGIAFIHSVVFLVFRVLTETDEDLLTNPYDCDVFLDEDLNLEPYPAPSIRNTGLDLLMLLSKVIRSPARVLASGAKLR